MTPSRPAHPEPESFNKTDIDLIFARHYLALINDILPRLVTVADRSDKENFRLLADILVYTGCNNERTSRYMNIDLRRLECWAAGRDIPSSKNRTEAFNRMERVLLAQQRRLERRLYGSRQLDFVDFKRLRQPVLGAKAPQP